VEISEMITQVSTTIELNPELTNLAYEMGLNASKICANALKLAIKRLQGLNIQNVVVDEPGFEPGTSTMPTWRSCQTDLLAQSIWLLNLKSSSFNKHFLWTMPKDLRRLAFGYFVKTLTVRSFL
jgi:hypothetical protein